jgi:L,D-transpeptidase catalytic domain
MRIGSWLRIGSCVGSCISPRHSGSLIGAALAISFAATAEAAILVNIDKSGQRMTVAVDGATRYVWPVSTGRAGYDTPTGTFKVNRMDADHQSQEWDGAPMPHTMFFDLRGHAIHGFFDVKHLGLPVSHGCVRLAPANAATLFALVQSQGMGQTTVVVSGQAPARGGEEMARRRAPAVQTAAQPQQVAPPGSEYQPAPPQPYPADAYWQQQTYYRQVQQPPPAGYYRPAPQPYYGQQQPYYAQQPPGYYPPQPPPVYMLRPPGLY